jgi:hypothetical protein
MAGGGGPGPRGRFRPNGGANGGAWNCGICGGAWKCCEEGEEWKRGGLLGGPLPNADDCGSAGMPMALLCPYVSLSWGFPVFARNLRKVVSIIQICR